MPARRSAGSDWPRRGRPCRLIALSGLLAIAAAAGESREMRQPADPDADNPYAHLDWVPHAELPRNEQRRVPRYCAGGYVQGDFPLPLESDPWDEPVEAEAGRMEHFEGDRTMLSDGVRLYQGNRSVTTPLATLFEREQRLELSGPVGLREPNLRLWSDAAEIGLESGSATASNAEFVMHENRLRGTALHLERDGEGNLHIRRASVTRCEPGHPGWALAGRAIRIEEGATHAEIRHATLRLYRVPVLYTPYLRIPITDERVSGWLVPDIDYSDQDGLDFALPYYFNLAPNYDATVTPRVISERGPAGELELRHLGRRTRTTLGGAFLYSDDRFDGELSRRDFDRLERPGSFDPANRWLVSVNHFSSFNDFRARIDFAEVSDDDYFSDLGAGFGVTTQRRLERRGQLSYGRGSLFARLWAQDFQILDPGTREPYQRLPALDASWRHDLPGPLAASWQGQWARFDRDKENLTGIDRIVGQRLHIEPRVVLPLDYIFGFLRLEGGYRFTAYHLDDVPLDVDDTPTRTIAHGSADGGLFFERELSLFGERWVQTLEPRLFYRFQERSDQSDLPLFDTARLTFSLDQLYRDNTFSGSDRFDDAHQLSASVTSRFLRGPRGQERLRVSLGQIYHFRDRSVTLRGEPGREETRSQSPLAGELRLSAGAHWSLQGSTLWDPDQSRFDEGSVRLQYRSDLHRPGDGRRLFNLGYRVRQDRSPAIEQGEVSMVWPLARRWNVLGSWTYDIELDRTIEAFGGLEYNDCCWQVRLIGRTYQRNPRAAEELDRSTGTFVQVVFKGLAGLGDRVESVLESGIRGYRPGEIDGF